MAAGTDVEATSGLGMKQLAPPPRAAGDSALPPLSVHGKADEASHISPPASESEPVSLFQGTQRCCRLPWRPYTVDMEVLATAYYPGTGTAEDPYLVDWLPGGDHENPLTWSAGYRWAIVFLVALSTLAVGFCSSAYSGAARDLAAYFHVTNSQILVLGISTFVLGFAFGPLLWAPLSEVFGRRNLFLISYGPMVAFNAACAVAPTMAALIVLRLFAGTFGSSPFTNAGGTIADMFTANQRGVALCLWAVAPMMGPVLGPIVGGFTSENVGWRWVEWVMTIFTGVLLFFGWLFMPETYAPVLLQRRARELSQLTGKVYKSKFEKLGGVKLGPMIRTTLTRPWVLLFTEPIVLLLSLYMAIIYGILYMFFAAFPIVFQKERGWSPGIGGLPFTGMAVGMFLAVAYTLWDNKRYIRVAEQSGGRAPAEARLPPAIIGAVALPIGLFWFAWTNYPSIHWIVCVMATAPFGFGMVLVFLSCSNYLVDSYLIHAASVLAANAVLRSLFGAMFPLFTTNMYADLGIHWASTIPAFLALACLPFPIIFWKHGAAVRRRCKYAAEAEAFMVKMAQMQKAQSTAGANAA